MEKDGELICELLSYSFSDLTVSNEDETRIIKLIKSSSDIHRTLKTIKSKGFLGKMFTRINTAKNKEKLIQTIAGKMRTLDHWDVIQLIKSDPKLKSMFERSYELQYSLRQDGLVHQTPTAISTNLQQAYSVLSTSKSNGPFSGSGASGIDQKTIGISLLDKALLAIKDSETLLRYSNPLTKNLYSYLPSLTPEQRRAQAIVLLNRPIVSLYQHSYQETLPSRASIINVAARKYRLEGSLIAAFILAEQRDQSKLEDAAEYIAASSILEKDTSIGLGQVKISTVRKLDLFNGLLPFTNREVLGTKDIADLLTSDDFNIFSTAKYIRYLADMAMRVPEIKILGSLTHFPETDQSKFQHHSSLWPDGNIKILASEYTSIPWDNKIYPNWANFVFEAYKDVKNSRIFND